MERLTLLNNKISHRLNHFKVKLTQIWFDLNTAQRLYLLALLLLPSENLVLVSIPAALALSIEFWPRFVKSWDSILGKAIILLIYATIANFALVNAAGVINEITTVSAEHFTYSHNFAILLFLPSWIIGISFIFLLMFQLIMPFYLLALLALKPFGIKGVRLISRCEFPFTTALIRFIVAMVLLVQVIALSEFGLNNQAKNFISGVEHGFNNPQSTLTKDQVTTQLPVSKVISKDDLTFGVLDENNPDMPSFSIDLNQDYPSIAKTIIADFIYELEADEFSRCEHIENTKVVELNDYEIVEISKSKTAKFGYQFTVKKCVSPAFPAN
ncbi:hypothetical protein [Pseudoalteromonas tunicata]|uniref:hypothetical protein n=1 Tax=Pseudoalteromonas tunicata TaxID=314281 RepID=UPI00273FB3BB|nr:hypothetical protein [Pseudoalteromonas tunicata]MDP4983372.1 hypothetical protein [Pseudoalteromonas tunicata]MDP5212747.1 hypothetical protein [Pseudoalteromonas tunicata]